MVLDGVLGEVSMQEGGCIASPSSSSVDLFSMLGESDDVTFSVVRWHHAMRHWLATTTAWDEGKDARCEKKKNTNTTSRFSQTFQPINTVTGAVSAKTSNFIYLFILVRG